MTLPEWLTLWSASASLVRVTVTSDDEFFLSMDAGKVTYRAFRFDRASEKTPPPCNAVGHEQRLRRRSGSRMPETSGSGLRALLATLDQHLGAFETVERSLQLLRADLIAEAAGVEILFAVDFAEAPCSWPTKLPVYHSWLAFPVKMRSPSTAGGELPLSTFFSEAFPPLGTAAPVRHGVTRPSSQGASRG